MESHGNKATEQEGINQARGQSLTAAQANHTNGLVLKIKNRWIDKNIRARGDMACRWFNFQAGFKQDAFVLHSAEKKLDAVKSVVHLEAQRKRVTARLTCNCLLPCLPEGAGIHWSRQDDDRPRGSVSNTEVKMKLRITSPVFWTHRKQQSMPGRSQSHSWDFADVICCDIWSAKMYWSGAGRTAQAGHGMSHRLTCQQLMLANICSWLQYRPHKISPRGLQTRGGSAKVLPPGKARLWEFDDVVKLNLRVKSWWRRSCRLVGGGGGSDGEPGFAALLAFKNDILLVYCESHTSISIMLTSLLKSLTVYDALTYRRAGSLRSETAVSMHLKAAEYFTAPLPARFPGNALAKHSRVWSPPGYKHQILLRPLLHQVPRDQCTSNQRSLTPQHPGEVIVLLIPFHSFWKVDPVTPQRWRKIHNNEGIIKNLSGLVNTLKLNCSTNETKPVHE